ncbi:glycosyltransferase involved in cell wall biosynthesis [Desulfosalsimonas propionicica]|uniref:Glycosyltransferase involved in cell wall biosynthesis n=1 Tax=Desulfosalsimonas propionicica TaxID=332175 RepID=A0A7W0HKN8_9BACT|nr:glycosyltransferase [Desulfosalsimonas propionicica]MBA2881479.1 glycosyltransferase involved in cell wall biosynthesis [Desulfosalsimonas propionicica]
MKKLTIIFTTNHADTLGNACRLDMVEFLTKYFEVTIITNQPEFIKNRFPNELVIPFNSNEKSKLSIVKHYKYQKKLARKINKISSDGVFLFHEDSPAAIWIESPVFQYIHQYGNRGNNKTRSPKEYIKKIISKVNHRQTLRGLKKSRINFVVSTFLIDLFKQEGLTNMAYTPHAMDIDKFQKPLFKKEHQKLKELKDEGYFIVSYTGWVTENRGYQLMMDSIKKAAIQDDKIVLVIAGADAKFSQCIADFQKNNNLEDNIINYGVIDSALIPGILYYSDVCLSLLDSDVPAFQVSPPQKLFEYFAAGKPVICNKVQTHSMFVEDGKTGFLLDMDPLQASKSIKLLKDNEKMHQTMCNNAFKEASKYDINLVYGNMVEKIKDAINEHKKQT